MRGVLALFEGVATGAADGYARIAGKPAAVLLHLGPGLANGLANLHNARRARTRSSSSSARTPPATSRYDAPLQSDIEALARTVSGWVHTSGTSRDLAQDAMRAVAAAQSGQIATLVLPADVSWSEGATIAPPRTSATASASASGPASGFTVDHGRLLVPRHAPPRRDGPVRARPAGGQPDQRRDRRAAAGRDVPARLERGAGVPGVDRLAYLAEQAEAQLAGVDNLILAGARSPESFFAYPDRASDLAPPGGIVTTLAEPDQDAEAALELLAEQVAAGAKPVLTEAAPPPPAEPAR